MVIDQLERPLRTQLQDRLAAATGEAQRLLGVDAQPVGADEITHLRGLIDGLSGVMAQEGGDGLGPLVAEQQAALARLHDRFRTRFEALEGVRRAVGELRAITSPADMLSRAPAALAGASRFDRVLLSLSGDGHLAAEAVHFAGEHAEAAQVLAAFAASPIRLEHPLIETELLRRRRATIVDGANLNPRVEQRLVELMGWTSYAAAPLVVAGQVMGMVHAGRRAPERLDVLDRDVLWEFTSLLAQAYESASLRRTLRHEREQTREFMDWLGGRTSELMDAPIRLATMLRPPEPAVPIPAVATARGGRDDRIVFEGLLTRRELDVLRLLAEGRSNRRIAEALVISEGTVKFHVNSILRKLRVANRAEAVSRYLRLLGMRAP
ncbi:MAG TPA: LuxR C-terminal-related transcriptional regulator [Solirubrobacteraceae bacterium]|jgi:DNA-binding CsgD family transcriptional regulator|nr:LuxR C-terminal-related transcriptional regulator [Solirubrobacteraceae bacterium]